MIVDCNDTKFRLKNESIIRKESINRLVNYPIFTVHGLFQVLQRDQLPRRLESPLPNLRYPGKLTTE